MRPSTLFFFAVLQAVALFSVNGEFFFQPIKPLYIVQKSRPPVPQNVFPKLSSHSEEVAESREAIAPVGDRGRSDLSDSSEETQGDDRVSGEVEEGKNFTRLPSNFDEDVRRNRPPLEPARYGHLYGDPAAMEEDTEEQDRSRYLWPFSTTVTLSKTKNIHRPHHPPPHLTYHDYVEQMYNQANGHGWDDDDDVPPLTDEEILHSKGYKKYMKKKKKKVKFLKKKLIFKRWIQKVLEKKISYLDVIAPY